MKILCKHIIFLAFSLLLSGLLKAQDLPVLPDDPAVKTGVLPNGTRYYVASNPNLKGFADFALVQRTGTENISDSCAGRSVMVAREALSALPRCLEPSLQSFMTSHGVTPGKNGFVKVTDNATVFHFENILLSSRAVMDSTLLVLFDVIDRVHRTDDEFIRRWYSPSDQAIIISGDVNVPEVISKMEMLSLMTPSSPSLPRSEYVWKDCDTAVVVQNTDSLRNLSSVSFTWRSSRTPNEYLNTVQPAIYEMFVSELGMLAEEKIREKMREKGIPLIDISHSHVMSVDSSGDESLTISIHTPQEFFLESLETAAEIFSDIDRGNAQVIDIARMKQICMDSVHEKSIEPVVSNSAYIDKCTASFLYNGSLATLKSKVDFLGSRQISDSTELRLFNNISSALLDPEKNLEIRYTSDFHPDSVRTAFNHTWNTCRDSVVNDVFKYTVDDIPEYYQTGKMKLRQIRTDHMSGSRVWVFSNGFTVVYKKMPTGGRIHWCLAQNGGYSSIHDLAEGEGGYVSDYLFLSTIAGVPAEDFLKVLSLEGIHMESKTGLSEMLVRGYAPKEKIRLLMRSLLAVMNHREPDHEISRYYAECESFRHEFTKGTLMERRVCIDSIMSPDRRFSALKNLDTIPDALAVKADAFYKRQAEKMNDGILLLIGDEDEDELKKLLLEYVGGFRTTDKAFRRARLHYQPYTGESTYTVKGGSESVDIAMSVPLALTADNFMAAEIAALMLKKRISEAIVETGMYMDLYHVLRVYPQESFNMILSMGKAPSDGYAADVEPTGSIEALSIVRSCLASVSDMDIPDSELQTMKSQLKNSIAIEMTTPTYWMRAIPRRFLSGKDFTTGYESRIDAVTADKVRSILSQLDKGSKVEYIISR